MRGYWQDTRGFSPILYSQRRLLVGTTRSSPFLNSWRHVEAHHISRTKLDKREELLKEAEKLAKHMSSYHHDLPPDLTSQSAFSTEAKEGLLDQCEHIWAEMEKCQSKLIQLGPETVTENEAQLTMLMMQGKALTAEYHQWKKRDPEIISNNPDVVLELGKREMQKVHRELKMVLSSVRSEKRKLKEELKTEQQWLEEQQQLVQALTTRKEELQKQVVHIPEKRVCQDIEDRILKVKAYRDKIVKALEDFLEEHFPLPSKDAISSKKRKSLPAGPPAQLKTLYEILETLLNKLLTTPHDPYISTDESYWPPYIELLLRNGIALRHSEDPNRLRLEAFHQ